MTTRNLREEIENAPDAPATLWQPAVGDTLIGTLIQSDMVTSRYGPDQPRLVIHTEGGEAVTLYVRHTVLRRELDKHVPGIGDRIAIRRLSDQPGKNYRRYKVLVEHQHPTATLPAAAPAPPVPLLTRETPAPVADDDDDISYAFGPDTGGVQ